MQNRVIEIASDGVHLSLSRGFLKLTQEGVEIGRIAINDIGALIIRGYGASLSINIASRLADKNIPVVLCGQNQAPTSIIWPISGHHSQGHIFEAQSNLTKPNRKRLWQELIRAKLNAQADALEADGINADDIKSMARFVKSGDPDNIEAQAARRYWSRMMRPIEPEFSRNSNQDGINGWLNYGYTVLRAATARSILAAGLHPSLSIHHSSRGEALRLASDIMEPF